MIIIVGFIDQESLLVHSNTLLGLAQHSQFLSSTFIQGGHQPYSFWHVRYYGDKVFISYKVRCTTTWFNKVGDTFQLHDIGYPFC